MTLSFRFDVVSVVFGAIGGILVGVVATLLITRSPVAVLSDRAAIAHWLAEHSSSGNTEIVKIFPAKTTDAFLELQSAFEIFKPEGWARREGFQRAVRDRVRTRNVFAVVSDDWFFLTREAT